MEDKKLGNIMSHIQIEITDQPILSHAIIQSFNEPSHGAQSLFFGVVRDHNHGNKVIAVSYDAFIPMVDSVFQAICQESQMQWGPDLKLIVKHRIGRLKVGEVSVAIAVSSRHRNEAFLASRYIIEQIKIRAPIWKKEHYLEGETEWLEGHSLCQHE